MSSRKMEAAMASLCRRKRRKTISPWLSSLGMASAARDLTLWGSAAAAVIRLSSAQLNARVDQGVEHVAEQGGHHGQESGDEQDGHGHRVVVAAERVEE